MASQVHFAVESRSGAVNGVLLEGPDLDSATEEGPKARNAAVEETMEGTEGLGKAMFPVIRRDSQQPKLGGLRSRSRGGAFPEGSQVISLPSSVPKGVHQRRNSLCSQLRVPCCTNLYKHSSREHSTVRSTPSPGRCSSRVPRCSK